MSLDKYNRNSRNQGVNAQTDSEKSQTSTNSKGSANVKAEKRHINPEKSLNQVKDDVKTVIELMGPTTPHFELSSAAEILGDSIYSNATEEKPNTQSSQNEENSNTEDQPMTTDCDLSQLPTDNFTQQDTDISMVVDNPSALHSVPVQCICPPPTLPVNFVYNSECMCPQMANYIHGCGVRAEKKKSEKTNLFSSLLKSFKDKKTNTFSNNGEYYKINIQQAQKNLAPKRLVFDLVDNVHMKTSDYNYVIPEDTITCAHMMNSPPLLKNTESKYAKNEDLLTRTTKQNGIIDELLPVNSSNKAIFTKKKKFNQKTTYTDLNGATRVDVYYFDHGCSSYFRTTDRSPVIATEDLAERTEAYTTKFWAEIFGSFNIGCSFFISLILQFIRFFLYSILRPLTVGLLQLISDYFFKPMLTTIFNAVIQPILIFLYNIITSLRDICDPIAEAIGYFFREIAVIIRAFRLVEVRTGMNEISCATKLGRKNRPLQRINKSQGDCIENAV